MSTALVALLACGWLLGTGPTWLWTLVIAGVVFAPTLLGSFTEFIRKPQDRTWTAHALLTGHFAGRPLTLALLAVAFLPYDALICLDAIVRSGVRMLFTRRGLLMWHTKSYARRNARCTLPAFFLEMLGAPLLATGLGAALWTLRPEQLIDPHRLHQR